MDLDQRSNATKLVRMGSVAYVPRLSRNLLPTLKAVKQWENPLSSTKQRLFWGFRQRSRSFSSSTSQGIVFGKRRETDPESRDGAGGGSESVEHNS